MKFQVKKCVDLLDLGKQLKLSDIEAIFWAIQTSLASHKESPIEQISMYILPDGVANTNGMYFNLVSIFL